MTYIGKAYTRMRVRCTRHLSHLVALAIVVILLKKAQALQGGRWAHLPVISEVSILREKYNLLKKLAFVLLSKHTLQK